MSAFSRNRERRGDRNVINIICVCVGWVVAGGAPTPYERLYPQTSVWNQEIDSRRIDATHPAEYRETLGVYPIGNGRCFAYAGLGIPQNTLFMITGPALPNRRRPQSRGRVRRVGHQPQGIGIAGGTPVPELPQRARCARGAHQRAGRALRLTTVTAAPPGTCAILRWITVERLEGASGDVDVAFDFPRPRDAAG